MGLRGNGGRGKDGTRGLPGSGRAAPPWPGRWRLGLLVVLFFLALAVAFGGGALAGEVVITGPDLSLGGHLDLLEDPGGTLGLADVLSGPAAARFTPATRDTPGFARTRSAYWARLTLDNPTDATVNRLLVFTYPYYHALDLYIFSGAGAEPTEQRHVAEGAEVRGTDIPHRYPVFTLALAPGRTVVYMRVEHYFASFALYLRTSDAQAQVDRRDILLHGLTFGVLIIAAAYQFALVVMAGVEVGVTLLFYALITLAYIYGQLGYPWEHLPAELASHYYREVVGTLPVAVGQIFAVQFLDLRRRQPWIARLLLLSTGLLVLDTPLHYLDPARGSGIAQVLALVGSVLALTAAIRDLRRSVNARFFLLGFLPILGVAVVWSLRAGGVLPAAIWTEAALYAPNAIGLVLFTFGVAYRIGKEREERERALQASEAALRRANDELEDRVRTRTAELSDSLEKLKRSQDALVQSEKLASLGQLVAGVAHEINTPIGVTLTTASHVSERVSAIENLVRDGRLRRSDLTDFMGELTESARLMLANIGRAASLIQSFKQVSADQSSEERRRVELCAYMEEVLSSLGPSLRRGGHVAEVVSQGPVELETYPGLLAQVLTNFVSNSILHGYDAGVRGRITVSARRLAAEEGGGGAEIIYQDDGRGIPPAILPRIFDPFFTTRRGAGGTGLGLNIVYNLVTHRLKGTVRVTSETGAGTRFILVLPDLCARDMSLSDEGAREGAQEEAAGGAVAGDAPHTPDTLVATGRAR
ncbi:sensor histidine kinase [Nitrospirillum iridis]|uniref:histidine kinase n=1 Tax=Nitrospirillum iridis TaxID=765888 RepID=A0A7X0B0A5_9PROT|nr:sensor histidine kinase [Nitrospirillum iridis]MBB6253414.1 signal transduction histidine kinase [Nitrospirillum iridis]